MAFTMITFLEGILQECLPTQVAIDVRGVGYEVFIPLSTYDTLPAEGEKLRLLTHLAVREDAHTLYGFASAAERDLFRLLVQRVSGVGPKVALGILSGMRVEQFKAAVVAGDVELLAQVKGLGKRTAERIVVELKDKVGVTAAWQAAQGGQEADEANTTQNDAVLALIALGYKQADAQKAVKAALKSVPEAAATVDHLLREALRQLQ